VLAFLLVPGELATAAPPRVRALNAADAGTVTVRIDGRPRLPDIAAGSVSRRLAPHAGGRVFSVVRGGRVLVSRRIVIRDNEAVTLVFLTVAGRPQLRVIREAAPDPRAARFRVANMTDAVGAIDVLLGGATTARALPAGRASLPRRVTHEVTRTGTTPIAVRLPSGQVVAASAPLIVATQSSATFALLRTAGRLLLLRLPYDVTPPSPLAQPQITGIPRVPNTVRCQRDGWPTGVARRLQWTLDGASIAGAT
jgi:hypothetical protein